MDCGVINGVLKVSDDKCGEVSSKRFLVFAKAIGNSIEEVGRAAVDAWVCFRADLVSVCTNNGGVGGLLVGRFGVEFEEEDLSPSVIDAGVLDNASAKVVNTDVDKGVC